MGRRGFRGFPRLRVPNCNSVASIRMFHRPFMIWLILLSCLAPTAALAQTPEPDESDGEVAFTAQGLPNPRSTDVRAVASRQVLRAFLEQNPDIQIEPFIIPRIEGASLDAGPLMAIAAGIPPHTITVYFRQSSTYMQRGFLLPLEIILARTLSENEQVRQVGEDGEWVADPTPQEIDRALALIKQRVPGPAWPVVYRQRAPDEPAHVWALPPTLMVKAMLYRKDLFAAAGLDPEQPPRDWEELLKFARMMTIPERRQYGFGLQGQPSFSTYTFLVSNGGRMVAQRPDGEWRAVWDTREAAEAYEFVWHLDQGRCWRRSSS